MSTPPLFQRSPRLSPDLPRGEVEIPNPPSPPNRPSSSLLTLLLPLGATVVGLSLSFYLRSRTAPGASPLYLLLSLPMMLISYTVSVFTYIAGRKQYARAVKAREAKYGSVLSACRDHLMRARETQLQILLEQYPSPRECLARVERLDARLWERSPQDADFLSLRLGLGSIPCTVTAKPPRQDLSVDSDPLRDLGMKLAENFRVVDGAPIALPMKLLGAAGLVGARREVLAVARALAIQIAALHSPDEVKIVAIFPPDEVAEWGWLRWLPHVWREDSQARLLAGNREGAQQLLTDLFELLNRRRLQASGQRPDQAELPLPAYIVIMADPSLVQNHAALPLILRDGKSLGAFTLVLGQRREELPQECRGIVRADSGELIQTTPALVTTRFQPDQADFDQVERIARQMAPLRLQRMAAPAQLPKSVPLLDLFEVSRVEELDVRTRWRKSAADRSLATPVGIHAGGERLLFDLHEKGHGPHGLVAGATGSGKSELLQAIIASLAVSYHPHEVAFVLVDYKGGGMANVFADLPHLVGTITNLQGHLALRALSALKGELKRRQAVLAAAGVNHIDDYQSGRRQGLDREPMPHLVIIVDEFAELKTEQPEFMRELVSAVRVGRSLGIHLILATQKPAGVVDDQIWGNTRFRLCLRVERPEDSREVLKRPDAAALTRPGRAYFQVGNDERFDLFQAGYGGGSYIPGRPVPTYGVYLVAMDGSRHSLSTFAPPVERGTGETQLQALIRYVAAEARAEGITRLPGPWLPPLPEQICLDELSAVAGGDLSAETSWLSPVIGLVDQPAAQYQGPLRAPLADGHMAIFGAPGNGKTTVLQTLITSLALSHAPPDLHMYILDFGGRTLSVFAALPQVGGVILVDDAERMSRLQRYLLREMNSRKERFALLGVNTLTAYRQAEGSLLPAIVLLIDNWSAMIEAYPDAEETMAQIAREGGNLGIHLVMTANAPGAIRPKIFGSVATGIALPLSERSDYGAAVGRTGGLEPAPVPGRAVMRGTPPLEFQTALAVRGETEAERSAALRDLVSRIERSWSGPKATPIHVLPDVVPLSGLLGQPAQQPLSVPLGLDVDTLEPLCVSLADGPHFLVSGGIQSGKSTLLRSWVLSLAAAFPRSSLLLYLADFRGETFYPMQSLPQVQAYLTDDAGLAASLAEIDAWLRERREALDEARRQAAAPIDPRAFLARYPALVLVADDLDGLRSGMQARTGERLEQLLRRERGSGFHFVAAGTVNDFHAGWDGWLKALKELQTGFLLGSSEGGDLQLLNIRLPHGEGGRIFPPGRGYFARRGRFRRIKIGIPDADGESTEMLVHKINRQWEEEA